jgi:hypothetical protein
MPIAVSADGGFAIEMTMLESAPAPARVTIYVPAGFRLDTSAAPGTHLGELFVEALSPTDDEYALGTIAARDPAASPAVQACVPGAHAAAWVASFSVGAPSREVEIFFAVDPTTGSETALGAFRLVACLPARYVPPDQGGDPSQLQLLDLDLALSERVIASPSKGDYTWRLLVTPYVAGTATVAEGATFEARARMLLPHVMTEHLRYERKTKTVLVTGRVMLRGKPERGLVITVAGGAPKAEALEFFGRARTRADGTYSFRKRIAQLRRPRKLRVHLFGDLNRGGACVDPSVAPAGCLDQSYSPPRSTFADLIVPKKRR